MTVTATDHKPVLLEESIRHLIWRADGRYVDGTFGGGGHAQAILDVDPRIRVIALDRDMDAVGRGKELQRLVGGGRLTVIQANFAELDTILDHVDVPLVDGILLDLGMSSFQLDDPDRGFAFRLDGPLDMRFDQRTGSTAAELLATLDVETIASILYRYGEERKSRRIAAAIVARRASNPIVNGGQLADLVERVLGRKTGRGHPATRTFQALRIAVNAEFESLDRVLEIAVDRLADHGRLVVIAFHSLEDRIVKTFIADQSRTCICPPEQIVCTCDTVPTLRRLGSSRKPSAAELQTNPRARSAVLRVAERVPRSGGSV